jgi:tetratricopeptide (TPR) repeat protein
MRGRLAQAEQFLRSALSLYKDARKNDNPQLAATLGSLSAVLRKQEKWAEAEEFGRKATEALDWYRCNTFDSSDPQSLKDLAWLLATSSARELRDGPGAVTLAERAVTATERKDVKMLDTLAAAYAEAGYYAKAVAAQDEAILGSNLLHCRRLLSFTGEGPSRAAPTDAGYDWRPRLGSPTAIRAPRGPAFFQSGFFQKMVTRFFKDHRYRK